MKPMEKMNFGMLAFGAVLLFVPAVSAAASAQKRLLLRSSSL